MLRIVSARRKPGPQFIQKRLRSTKTQSKRKPNVNKKSTAPPSRRHIPSKFFSLPRPANSPFLHPTASQARSAPPANLSLDGCHEYFQQEVQNWSTSDRTLARFARFGYDADTIRPFLALYVSTVQSGFFSSPEKFTQYQLVRLTTCGVGYGMSGVPGNSAADKPHLRLLDAEVTFSNIFFSWIVNESGEGSALEKLVVEGKAKREAWNALKHLAITSERRPAEHFESARKMRRSFIMHVGPTNSGKTHHALRALAASKNGVYAGPLRLLAHEIWERLNLGQIVPLGVDIPPPPTPTQQLGIALDESIAPQAKINTNPAYARLTNMVTGEERKVVDEDAPLLACTIEMLSFRHHYDVAVIDEIQMIGDPERGFAWTDAVLGLCAKEIHLCGEESAIPVIQQLLKETGDELTIRRYERLTPLIVEEKSLDGDFSKVTKGDAVVAFSRTRIFEIKREVEKNGLRCAVVYGKLPPEIRSEQAGLFNDPDSGFDVIIGSDAIGMGLNLKIQRIIFDRTMKPSGGDRLIPLSISQIKQIAGRAGRFGHTPTGEKPGGFATTLFEMDLPVLREALAQPSTPTLTHAYIGPTPDSLSVIAPALLSARSSSSLSSDTTTPQPKVVDLETVQMAHIYTALPPSPVYKYTYRPRLAEICAWVEQQSKGVFTWNDKLDFMLCPVPWRDGLAVEAAQELAELQREEMSVVIGRIKSVVGDRKKGKKGLIWALEEVERIMRETEKENIGNRHWTNPERTLPQPSNFSPSSESLSSLLPPLIRTPTIDQELLEQLEGFHKILVVYMWSHFRNAVVYADRETAEDLKHRVEVALDWGLREVGSGERAKVERKMMKERKELAEKAKVEAEMKTEAEVKAEVDAEVDGWSTSRVGEKAKMETEAREDVKVKKDTRGKADVKGKGKGKGKKVRGKDKKKKGSPEIDRPVRADFEGGLRSFENYNSRTPAPGSHLSSSRPSPPPPSPSPPSSTLQSYLKYRAHAITSKNIPSSSLIPPPSSYYPPPSRPGPSLSARTNERTNATANAKNSMYIGYGGVEYSNVGIGSSNVSPAGWTKAPDLTTLLKMYVDNPTLRVDGGRGGSGRK